jgi:hypothetical protein
MVPTTVRQRSQAWKPWAALGVGSLSLAALSAQPASALGTYGLDNTADQTINFNGTARFQLSTTQWLMRSFKMGPLDAYLKDLNLGYNTNSAASRTLTVNIFEVSSAISPLPLGASKASGNYTVTGTGASTTAGWFTAPVATGPVALKNFLFQAGKNYGIVFSSTGTGSGPVGIRYCNSPLASCNAIQPPATAGGITLPIVANGSTGSITTNSGASWTAGTGTGANQNFNSAFMEINFTPVPAPALMGFSSLSGLMVYSRRLRSRIKGSAA